MLRGRTRQRPVRMFQRTEANPNMSEIAKQRRMAEEKARDLLLSHLTPFQRLTYESAGYFYTRGSDGIIYGLRDGTWVSPIKRGTGKAEEGRGVHAINYSDLPVPDRLLSQKLLLETNAKWVNKVACRSGRHYHMPDLRETLTWMEETRREETLLEEARAYLDWSWWDRLRTFISDALP